MAARRCLRRLRNGGSSDIDTHVYLRFLDLTVFFILFDHIGGHVPFLAEEVASSLAFWTALNCLTERLRSGASFV